MKTLAFSILMASIVLISSSASADSLYRCPDGTFTNKAERQCPPYEPKEIGRVHTRLSDEKIRDFKNDPKQPFASVGLFQERSKN